MADHGVVGGEDERSSGPRDGQLRALDLGEVQGDLLESTEAARRLRELTLPVSCGWRASGFLPEVREDIAEEVVLGPWGRETGRRTAPMPRAGKEHKGMKTVTPHVSGEHHGP